MGETTKKIEKHLRDTRDDLSANLNELEQKVKSMADWRQQFQKRPGTFLAVAAGGALVLALAARRKSYATPAVVSHRDSPSGRSKAGGMLEASLAEIKGALIGLAATQAKTVLSQLLPGFREHLSGKDKSELSRTYGSEHPKPPEQR